MPQDLAAFLDELDSYVERRIRRLPAPLARALARPGAALPMQTLLRILDCPQAAHRFLDGMPAQAPFPDDAGRDAMPPGSN